LRLLLHRQQTKANQQKAKFDGAILCNINKRQKSGRRAAAADVIQDAPPPLLLLRDQDGQNL